MLHLHDIPSFIIRLTNAKLTSYFQRVLKNNDLTSEQWTVICALDEKGEGITLKELSAFIDKDRTSVVRMIKVLEKRGAIRRVLNTEDKRSNYLFLTQEGIKLREAMIPLVEEINNKLAEGINSEEIAQLKYILNKIYDNATKKG